VQRFRDAPTAAKLLGGFAMVASLTVVVGVIGILRVGSLSDAVSAMYVNSTTAISDLGQVRSDFAAARLQGGRARTVPGSSRSRV